ncbi:MAG: nif-specific transcriptional activator NifA [Magnetococcales bacterium]|nr:nif-specific transcriptional activator NifA [Magnetococcales bacterium]
MLEPVTEDCILTDTPVNTIFMRTLFHVSQALHQSPDPGRTMRAVVVELHRHAHLRSAVITLVDPVTGALAIHAAHPDGMDPLSDETVRYRPGEGVLGMILTAGRTVMIPRAGDEPLFLNKSGRLDRRLPFIGVPIRVGDHELVGVLAAQPGWMDGDRLLQYVAFLEMVAHLLVQSILLARKVAEEKRELADHRDQLLREVRNRYGFDNMIGRSDAMRQIFEQTRLVSRWDTTVLIRGESGTGKELIAHAIHYHSPRARQPFVKLNCAALSDNLLESELFGHEKGAFTGAFSTRKGRFELAHGGTLFLDELGEISAVFQAKLLRVMQEGEFERVGGEHTIKVDVRIIAATHRHLEEAVLRGTFRRDLYYRLNVMTIVLPPLRARREDIPDIARFLMARISKRQGRRMILTDAALRLLVRHDWPGNVRELENCLERAAVICPGTTVTPDFIQIDLSLTTPPGLARESALPLTPPKGVEIGDTSPGETDERERVLHALRKSGWVKAKAARLLGMTPRQIAYRIKIHGIETQSF